MPETSTTCSTRIGAQRLDRPLLERVERLMLAATERQIRDEPVLDGPVVSADQLAELDRERRRDGDRAGSVLVVLGAGGHLAVRLQHAPDDVAGVERPHVVDDTAGLAGLQSQEALGQATQVEPDCQRQADQAEEHGQDQQRTHGSLLPHGQVGQSRHSGSQASVAAEHRRRRNLAERHAPVA